MAGVSIDTFGASFVHYMPGVVQTLNNTSRARLLPMGNKKWTGDYLSQRIRVRRNPAIAGVVDGAAIPAAGKATYTESKVYRKFIVGSVKVTDGLLINAADTKHNAITVMESKIRGLLDSIRKWENYMFNRDGTGVVALLGATVSGSTITVTDGRLMWEDAYYDIVDATTGATHVTFKVSSVARALTPTGETTITPSSTISAAGQAQNDYVVWRGSTTAGDSSYNRVPMGLDGMIDDTAGTFQGVDTSTYNRWTSLIMSHGGTNRELQPHLFREALAGVHQESGDPSKNPMTALMTYWMGNHFEEMYEGQIRLQPSTTKSGLKCAKFTSSAGDVQVVTDPDAVLNQITLADMTEISRAVQKELDWRPGVKGIFNPSQDNLHHVATCLEVCDFFIERRNRCAKIKDLKETRVTAFG